jgi:hypothetical protein
LILLSIGPLEFPTLVGRAARRRYRRNKLRARLDLIRDAARVAGIAHGIAVAIRGALTVIARRLYRWSAIGEARPRVATPDPAAITAMAIAAHPALPYPGRLTVVVGREARPPFLRDPREDLGGLATGGVEVVVLPGDAHDMLVPPGAGLLADLIWSRTDPARSERPQHPVP